MPRKVSPLEAQEQPLQWSRAIYTGMISTTFMMLFVDVFYLMGITPFSYEQYLGSLILRSLYSGQNWTVGFLANLVVGSLFGILYAYCFEYVFKSATARIGIRLGLWHALAAAAAFFPFFNSIHEFMNLNPHPNFGILGSGLGLQTTIILITGHLLYGTTMGLFYGPVQEERIRAKNFEPGETNVPEEAGGITTTEDPEDRIAV